jgi:hypothetical protein
MDAVAGLDAGATITPAAVYAGALGDGPADSSITAATLSSSSLRTIGPTSFGRKKLVMGVGFGATEAVRAGFLRGDDRAELRVASACEPTTGRLTIVAWELTVSGTVATRRSVSGTASGLH